MCAQRILRAGPGGDVIQSQPSRRDDPRQASFDLDAPASSPSRAEETIFRLSREVADLRMKLAGEGAPDSAEGTTYRSYHSGQGGSTLSIRSLRWPASSPIGSPT
jgi:hypothetical protein